MAKSIIEKYPKGIDECIIKEDDKKAAYTIDDDFKIFLETKAATINEIPCYVSYGILGICLSGSATIKVYLHEHQLKKGELVVMLPGQSIALYDRSDDFSINCSIVSETLINEILSSIPRLSPLFFIHMRKKPYYQLSEEEVYRYTEYYKLIYSRLTTGNHSFQKEYIINILKLFYLDLYNNYKNCLLSPSLSVDKRKEQLTFNFFLLIMEHHRENREVAFYAEKMFITPKYLSSVVKEVSDRPAKDWITDYILMEIKSLLKNSSLNIQEITVKTNFSNQASLGRFFRKHTGMSPSEYRDLNDPERKNGDDNKEYMKKGNRPIAV